MGIKEQTIQRAVAMLLAAGAKFHIVCEDGTAIGSPIVPERIRKQRTISGPSNKALIAEFFEGFNPGDVRVMKPQAGDTAPRLQTNICSAAGGKWGSGSVTTTVLNGAVEVLRVF